MTEMPHIVGICGAPCTGKTTLAGWLDRKFQRLQADYTLLPEIARIIAEQGVKIDKDMGPADYDAFLDAYKERDSRTSSVIALADRTPVDHFSYIEANGGLDTEFVDRHRNTAAEYLQPYRLILYLPIQFEMRGDGFRETDLDYQRALDNSIAAFLETVSIPVHVLRGEKKKRRREAFRLIEEAWQGQFQQTSAAGGG